MALRQSSRKKTPGGTNAAASNYGRRGPTAEEFVQKCLEEEGDEYERGGEYAPGTPSNRTREWDCSGLVYTKLKELGIDPPRSSTEQLNWCRENRTLISLAEGIRTRGALLLREGHVAVSLGDGRTIEAMGDEWGVGRFSAFNRNFTDGGLVPGLTYGRNRLPPLPAQPEIPAQPSARPTLRRGSSGSDVRFLQQRLKDLGYDPGPIDGIFGSRTEQAIKEFQAANRLMVDGIVGKNTWAALTANNSTPPPGDQSSRAELAQRILNSSKITLWPYSPTNSSSSDGADARSNIRDAAASKPARRSDYGNAPGGSVNLDTRLLNGMLELAKTYSFRVTSIAGGSHSSNSRHYAGIALDVDEINGIHVSASNPHYRAFMQQCRTLGAAEVLGPGDADHSTHVHCAWPRP